MPQPSNRSPEPLVLTRAGSLAPSSIDEKARTVDVVWSTGAPVRRWDQDGAYVERLSLEVDHVDLSRLRGGSVLDNHRADSLSRVLGVVTSAEVDGREGRATVRFSSRPEVEPIWADVRAGVIRHVSVGYTVGGWRDGRATDGTRERMAVKWQPRELSFVATPADAGASTRKDPAVDPELPTDAGGTGGNPPAVVPAVTDRAAINAEIRTLTEAAGLERTVADELIDRNATVEQARADMFDRLVQRTGTPIRHQRVEGGADHADPAQLVTRMTGALFARVSGAQPADDARQYMNLRTVDMARMLLEARGERGLAFLGPDELLRRAHTVGDFPQLLTGAGNRIMMGTFQAQASPLKLLARQTTIADFRKKSTLKISGFAKLQTVGESGEVKSMTRGEARESYGLTTKGGMFSLSRQAIINDDLGAFQDFSAAAGRAAAETEAAELLALLTANGDSGATLDDGKALFHADHGNKAAAGAAIAVASLGAVRLAMRSQTDLDGTTPINVTPKYLLTSAAKETLAEQVLASIYAATVGDVNPFSGKLQLLVEPRLSGNPWWVFAEPAQAPVLEYAYLSSAQGPQIASREGWDTLGMEFRVVLDFGCGVVDHRGAYLNPGA